MQTLEQAPSTAWGGCAKIVEAATKSCTSIPAPAATSPQVAEPHWDSLANSFAALSSAFAWGSILLALLAIVVGLAWGRQIAMKAENEARTTAKACAEDFIARWLADEAPGIIRAHVEALGKTSLDTQAQDEAADKMGEMAG